MTWVDYEPFVAPEEPLQIKEWEVKHLFSPISYEEYLDLAERFKQAAEKTFGTSCKMEIEAKFVRGSRYIDKIVDQVLQKGTKPTDISEEFWSKSTSVKIELRPIDHFWAPQGSKGSASFNPGAKRASFNLSWNSDYPIH